jgi:CBS domain-containing protein
MKARELCTRKVVVARRGDSVIDAARTMVEHHVGNLVVVDDTKGNIRPIGIVTDCDLVLAVLATGEESVAWSEVGNVMADVLLVARDTDDVSSVLRSMTLQGVRRIPVVGAGDELVGILSADDLLEWLREQMQALVELVDQEPRRARGRQPSGPTSSSAGLE